MIVRLPVRVHDALRAEAKAVGFTLNEYTLAILTQRGVPERVARRALREQAAGLRPAAKPVTKPPAKRK